MKKLILSAALMLSAAHAHAVSAPAYQNLLIFNAAVEALASTAPGSDKLTPAGLDEAVDRLKLNNIALTTNSQGTSAVSISTQGATCLIDISMQPVNSSMGSNPEYTGSVKSCKEISTAGKLVEWETIEGKIVKAAGRGKVTLAAGVSSKGKVVLVFQGK